MNFRGFVCILGFVFAALPVQAQSHVQVYPAPAGEPLSQRFSVKIDGHDSPVYLAHVRVIGVVKSHDIPEVQTDGEASFTSFDTDGKAEVTVLCKQDVKAAKVLPSSYGITPQVSGKTVTFTLAATQQATVEINGDWNNSLHVFANPVETDVPNLKDKNLIYYGPGLHVIGPQKIGSGKTVYIAGGAVVYGKHATEGEKGAIFALNGDNITVRGRGIIDGSLYPKTPGSGNILYAKGHNLKFEGVTLRDSNNWNMPLFESNHVTIDNMKIFGWRGNSDGFDVVNSQDVDISNSFLRTFDDLVVVKTRDKGQQPSKNITVKHMVLWNEIAHALTIGTEIHEPVENVIFSDCDVIHSMDRDYDLMVFNGAESTVRHVVFDDIRIEESRRIASLYTGRAYHDMPEYGHIDDVTFRNIRTVRPQSPDPIQFKGLDAGHAIHDVHFENVTIDGKPLKQSEIKANEFVTGVTVTP